VGLGTQLCRAGGRVERRGEAIGHDLFRLDVVGHVSFFVGAALEEPSTSEVARAPREERDVHGAVEHAQLGLVDEAVHQWQHPLGCCVDAGIRGRLGVAQRGVRLVARPLQVL
jgi:hypothetical protein